VMMKFVAVMVLGAANSPVELFVPGEKMAPAVQVALVYKTSFLEPPTHGQSTPCGQKNSTLFFRLQVSSGRKIDRWVIGSPAMRSGMLARKLVTQLQVRNEQTDFFGRVKRTSSPSRSDSHVETFMFSMAMILATSC